MIENFISVSRGSWTWAILANPFLNFIIIKILIPIIIIAVGMIAIKVLINISNKSMEKAKWDELLRNFMLKMIKMVCIVLLAMTILAMLGVPTASFIAVIGSIGLATALSWREVLANFAGGVILLINRPFSQGDYIDDLQVKGTVERVDLFFSTLKSDDGHTVIIPNNRLANTTITNYHKNDKE